MGASITPIDQMSKPQPSKIRLEDDVSRIVGSQHNMEWQFCQWQLHTKIKTNTYNNSPKDHVYIFRNQDVNGQKIASTNKKIILPHFPLYLLFCLIKKNTRIKHCKKQKTKIVVAYICGCVFWHTKQSYIIFLAGRSSCQPTPDASRSLSLFCVEGRLLRGSLLAL